MTPIFVDTSGFVALVDRATVATAPPRDGSLARGRRPLLTSTYVVDELLTLVRMRLGHALTVEVGEKLLQTHWCRVVDVSEDTQLAAWHLFVRYDDQPFSFTDCTSFALMRAMGIGEAFTFDRRDYSAAGFLPLP